MDIFKFSYSAKQKTQYSVLFNYKRIRVHITHHNQRRDIDAPTFLNPVSTSLSAIFDAVNEKWRSA